MWWIEFTRHGERALKPTQPEYRSWCCRWTIYPHKPPPGYQPDTTTLQSRCPESHALYFRSALLFRAFCSSRLPLATSETQQSPHLPRLQFALPRASVPLLGSRKSPRTPSLLLCFLQPLPSTFSSIPVVFPVSATFHGLGFRELCAESVRLALWGFSFNILSEWRLLVTTELLRVCVEEKLLRATCVI